MSLPSLRLCRRGAFPQLGVLCSLLLVQIFVRLFGRPPTPAHERNHFRSLWASFLLRINRDRCKGEISCSSIACKAPQACNHSFCRFCKTQHEVRFRTFLEGARRVQLLTTKPPSKIQNSVVCTYILHHVNASTPKLYIAVEVSEIP